MKNKKTINRVLQLIRPYTYLVVSILVLAAVTVAATLYSPILIGKGVDCMIEKGPVSFPDLKLVLLQLAVVTAISAISQWVMSLLTNKMTYKIVDDIRIHFFDISDKSDILTVCQLLVYFQKSSIFSTDTNGSYTELFH